MTRRLINQARKKTYKQMLLAGNLEKEGGSLKSSIREGLVGDAGRLPG